MEAYQRLKDLGLTLPPTPIPAGNYIPAKMCDDLLFLAGQGPSRPDGTWYTGKVGRDVTWEDAYEHARLVGLQLLGVAARIVGDLNRVEVIKVLGMVNAVPDFADHPKVINGCSDIFVAVLGDKGRHSRSAVGMDSLPNGMTVEVEAILRVLPRE
ncbi:RidA family protein [Mesorhizobium sp. M7A.F.Ca.US.006.01.1.1]|uniref:RidA family protein n=1 Tax=Mesorhizobium sp. M7A.F.Ca.US.006.01.1.1 TaxID=2496707 RepID=UPI000FCC93FF|nr:RidA family protein [Mesorhizobium sp. M7A.F.Ca.US.006.01.1.1]RUZ81375.1 RidA family protein [Mesorhizobium sp. M7A.F.Ca.US.006.01.1.1]